MVQTVSTIVSLLLGAGGVTVIVAALAEDWGALRHALAPVGAGGRPSLPAHTHRVPAPQAARIIRLRPEAAAPRRAAA